MKPPTTYVLLVRHGENDWVGTDRLAGRTPDVHLNDKGRSQSERLATLLADQPVSAVYSSPLERCLETATPVAAALGVAVTPEPGVMEVDYGEWQGAQLKELAKTPEWQLVQHYPSSFCFPGGESLHQVQARAVWTVDRIVRDHPNQLVAIFSHGDVIRTTLAHYMGTPLDLFQRLSIGTASISALAFHSVRPMVLFTNFVTELPKFEWKAEAPENGDPAVSETTHDVPPSSHAAE